MNITVKQIEWKYIFRFESSIFISSLQAPINVSNEYTNAPIVMKKLIGAYI